MTSGVSPRNERQLTLMADRLVRFRSGEVPLRRLIDDLNSLWSELEVPGDWSERFRSHWWTLEQVYSVAVDRGQVDPLPADFSVLISEAVDSMTFMLDELDSGGNPVGERGEDFA